MKPDAETLRELGESSTNVANAWAGAEDYLSRGLIAWVRQNLIDQNSAVRAAIAGCRLVIERYPSDGSEAQAPKQYLDDLLAKTQRWVDNPSNNNKDAVRAALDITRQLHAWQGHAESEHFWILEAVDHASLAVWANERSSYIVTLDYGTCVARSLACVLHALVLGGMTEDKAVALVTAVVG